MSEKHLEEIFNSRKELFKLYQDERRTLVELINSTERSLKKNMGKIKKKDSLELLYLLQLSRLEKRYEIELCLKKVELDHEEEFYRTMEILWERVSFRSVKVLNGINKEMISGVYKKGGVIVVTLKNSSLNSLFLNMRDLKKTPLKSQMNIQNISSKYIESIFEFLLKPQSQKSRMRDLI